MRVMDNMIKIFNPNSGDTLSFEYLIDHPVEDSGGTGKKRFTADSDVWRLDDDLIIMDIVWRYKKLIGLPDWQADHADYRRYLSRTQGQDAPAKTVYMGGESNYPLGVPHTDLWVNNE